MSLSAGEISMILSLKDSMSAVLKEAQGNLKDFGATATEAGEKSGIFGGILDGVFGSWPAKVAEGVLLRDAVHELINIVKDGAVEFGLMGSEVNTLHEGMAHLSGGVEQETAILNAMRDGVKGTLIDVVLMTQANKLMATGALKNADDFGTLTAASRVLSREGFGPIEQVMGTISNAMETGRARRLALMGVTVDTAGAETAYAKTLGLTASELSTSEKLHADRMAIMKAVSDIVLRAGDQELNLKERIEATRVSIKNWTDDLAATIAASPHVTAAYDAIKDAIFNAFGGDAKTLSAEFLEWINDAADAAKTYGPIVVQWLKNTAEYIIEVWHAVEQAWDRVPDWFKNVARDAILAGIAAIAAKEGISLLAGSLKGVADAGQDSLGTMADLAQIWSVVGGWIKPAITQLQIWGALISTMGWGGFIIGLQTAGAALVTFFATNPVGWAIAAIAAIAALAGAYEYFASKLREATPLADQDKVSQNQLRIAYEQSGIEFKNNADAMAWLNQNAADLRNGYTNLKSALDGLKDSGAFLSDRLVTLVDTVKGMSAAGTLSTAAMKMIATALKETGVATKDLDPALQAIVKAVDMMGQKAADGEPKLSKFEQAVRSMVDAFEGDSKKILENSEAIDRVVKSGNADIDVQTRLVDAIDQRIAKHLQLTDVQRTFYDANEALGARAIAREDAIAKSWDQYYQTVSKNQGDSLAVQDAATETWYGTSYNAIAKLGAKNADEWERLGVLNAEYFARLANNSDAHTQHEIDVATKIGTTWGEYYSMVARSDHEVLVSRLDTVDTWYDAQYAAIEKAAKANIDEWEKLDSLNALFWARITTTRTDFETAATLRIMSAETALTDFIAQQTMSSTDFQVTKIWEVVNQQIAADALSGKTSEELNAKRIALAAAQTDALYVDNAALLANSTDTLQAIADKAATTYDMMAAQPWKYTKAAIAAQGEIYTKAQETASGIVDVYGAALTNLSQMFVKMGQVAGGSFGAILGSIGQSVVGLEQAHVQAQLFGEDGKRLGGHFGALSTIFNDNAKSTDRMAAGVAAVGSVAQGVSNVMAATASHATAAGNAMGGAMAGMQAGAFAGPWGMAVGAAAGFMVGLIRGKPEWATVADEVGKDFGVKISDSLAKAISAAKVDFGGSTQAAGISMLSDIIKEAGGLSEKTFPLMTARLHDVFSMIETHQMTITQGAKVLDENFGAFAAKGTSSLGLLDKSLTEIIALNERFGTQSKAIGDYVAGQMTNAQTGFAAALRITAIAYTNVGTIQQQIAVATQQLEGQNGTAAETTIKKIYELNESLRVQQSIIDATGLHSQAAASAVGMSLVGIVNANMAAGMSFIDAIRKVGPSVQDLQTQLAATGFEGGAAFDLIREMVGLASNAIAGPALTSIEGYTAGMVGLSNAGILNQDTFSGLAGQIAGTEEALKAQGFSGTTVMLAMQKDLQTVWELQQRYGYTVDDTTKALLDDAVAAGIVGEKHKSSSEQMVDGINHVVDRLDLLLESMGIKLPNAISVAAQAVADNAGRMTKSLRDVEDAATGAAEGHSPSGIKQIIVRTKEAQAEVEWAAKDIVLMFGNIFKAATGAGDAIYDVALSVRNTIRDYQAASLIVAAATQAQKDFVFQAHEAGVSVHDIALMLGTTDAAVALYIQQMADAAAATKKFDDAQIAAVKSLADLVASTKTADLSAAANAAIGALGHPTIGGSVVSAQTALIATQQQLSEAALQRVVDNATKALQATVKGSAAETAALAVQAQAQQALSDLKTQHQVDNTRAQFSTEVEKLGMIPAEYERTYSDATKAIREQFDDQRVAFQGKRTAEIALLGPVPSEYSATYAAAVAAVSEKYDLLDKRLRESTARQLEALGPIPATYSATYTKAFGLVTEKYSELLTALGVSPDLPTMAKWAQDYELAYTSSFAAVAQRHRELLDELSRTPGAPALPPPIAKPEPGPVPWIEPGRIPQSLPGVFAGGVGSWSNSDVVYAAEHQATNLLGNAEWGAALEEARRRNLVLSASSALHMAQGGLVPYMPSGTDSVPAMLTPNERVLSVDQNAAYERGGGNNSDVVDGLNAIRNELRGLPMMIRIAIQNGAQRVVTGRQ